MTFRFGAFRLDAGQRVLYRDDQPVALTPKAVETLIALVERRGRVVGKDELMKLVWPDAFVEENNLAQNISALRRALGEPRLIETIPKRGYRFVGVLREDVAVQETTSEPVVSVELLARSQPPARRSHHRARHATVLAAVAAVTVTLAILADAWTRRSPAAGSNGSGGVTRVAVLPFVNLGAAADEYFVAGMTEEVASRLAVVSRLAVASSTTTTEYDRSGKTVTQIGSDLGVNYIVEGSVRWARGAEGTVVRITPKLIRVADDTAVWTHQYDAALSDLFKVQAEIAYQITDALQVVIEARERRTLEVRPTPDTEAYLSYLRGMAIYRQGASDTSNQARARAALEQAVARDPRFALAWSWLARVYTSEYTTGARRVPPTRQAAHRAAETAIGLAPRLPEARLARAQVLMADRAYDRARRELEIARAGTPRSPEVLRMIGNVEQRQGRWAESLRAYLEAFDLDPASMADAVAVHYLYMRQYAEARRFIEIAKAANHAAAVVPEAWLHFSETGDVAAARAVLEPALGRRTPADARVRGLLARLEYLDGRYERALELIETMDPAGAWLPANFRFPASLAAGQVFERMGRREDAARRYTSALSQLVERQRDEPDDYQIEAAMGLAAAGLGRAEDAVRHGRRAVNLLPVTKDAAEGPLYLYVLAQIQARVGRHVEAAETLQQLYSVPGFYNEQWVRRDPWLAPLHTHAR